MKLSTKCRYGARAIVQIARNYRIGPTKRKDIAVHEEVTDSYLENILITLRNNGIIKAIRGAKGGFILNRPPSEITMLEVVEAIQGVLAPVDCLENPVICQRVESCITRPVWQKMQTAQREALAAVTIQELVEKSIQVENG